jgi:hypothetical protein
MCYIETPLDTPYLSQSRRRPKGGRSEYARDNWHSAAAAAVVGRLSWRGRRSMADECSVGGRLDRDPAVCLWLSGEVFDYIEANADG